MKLTLGIDPGLTGAFALLNTDGRCVAVEDLPVMRIGSLGFIDGDALLSRLLELRAGNEMHAVIELVHAMPKNGSQAAFSQGLTMGSILSALRVARVPFELVMPSQWKRAMGLIFPKDMSDTERKHRSLDKARIAFPDAPLTLAKHHNRGEALLLAQFALTKARSFASAA